MKSILIAGFAGCLFFTTLNVNAQGEYKSFRVDLGLGLCTAFADKYGTFGAILYLEPKYAVISRLNIGFKYETGFNSRNYRALAHSYVHVINSYQITTDYYLVQNSSKPLLRQFLGAGMGVYHIKNQKNNSASEKSNFGAMLRAGFDIYHFRLMIAYNFAGKDILKNDAGYASITIGAFLGGGKR